MSQQPMYNLKPLAEANGNLGNKEAMVIKKHLHL